MGSTVNEREGDSSSPSFPGGHARLPRINRPEPDGNEPDVLFVESAFLHERGESDPVDAERGFEAYYSVDSLYDEATAGPVSTEEEVVEEQHGPYSVLGLTRSASWEEVARAHRSLVSHLHPDRYVDADDTVRAAAERRVRDVNEAYSTIRRERSGRSR